MARPRPWLISLSFTMRRYESRLEECRFSGLPGGFLPRDHGLAGRYFLFQGLDPLLQFLDRHVVELAFQRYPDRFLIGRHGRSPPVLSLLDRMWSTRPNSSQPEARWP